MISFETKDEQLQSRSTRTGSFSSKADVAKLRAEQISRLSREELIDAIRTAQMPKVGPEMEERLPYCDNEILRRMVFLARHCCRNQGY